MATEVAVRKPKRTKPRPKAVSDEEEEPLAGKSQTRAKFNEILQDAYLQSTKTEPKKKKKARGDKTALLSSEHGKLLDSKLESLRRGDGIQKAKDNSLLLANTYDPDDDPKNNKKSNKQRQAEMINKQNGVENQAYTEENETIVRKAKKKLRKNLEETEDKPMTISDLAPPLKEKKAQKSRAPAPEKQKKKRSKSPEAEVQRPTSPDPDVRKKTTKKKTKPRPEEDAESEEQILSEDGEPRPEDEAVTSDPELGQTKVKKKKKKKKKVEEDAVPAEDEEPPQAAVEDHGKVMGLTVHRTDKLKTDFLISHPLVRVSMVDVGSGNYLKKQRQDRPVTSYYEQEDVDFVLPIMSQPFDFKQNKSTLPIWEEMLLFNENFDYLVQDDPKVMLFFEILDFMSMNAASRKVNIDGGWHRIAWGFLKLVGGNGKPNTDRKVRLQLYQPLANFRVKKDGPLELVQWWQQCQRFPSYKIPYPSTLYITAKGIIPPEAVEPAARSMYATQEERGRITYDELQKTLDGGTTKRESRGQGPSLWTRLAGQLCKVPNNLFLGLPAGKKGCFVVRFSYDGKYLACGCHDKDGYPILIYEIPSGRLKGQLNGHYSIIYDLTWSRTHDKILTASADGTARVWDVTAMSNTPLKTLPHPSFVYAAKFHVRVDKVVVTGGYDRMLRVWTLKGDEPHAQLLQELDGHASFVNTLCFDSEGKMLYSADSVGVIRVWSVFVTDKPSSNGVLKEWTLQKEIEEPEFKGVAINNLKLHPSGRRLLVHTRDNILRLYDLRINAIMQRYRGALNFREHLRSTMSPCGSFVLTGSEDACAYVWNSDTGDQVASYKELGYRRPVSDVDFHPHDHMIALCSFGENHQVLVYKYDHRVAQRTVGLVAPTDPDVATRTPKKGRPLSPELVRGADPNYRSDDDVLDTQRSLTTERMTASVQHSTRMERARRKLDSVMTFTQSSTFRPGSPQHPLSVPRDTLMPSGTWGSTFDSTAMHTHATAMSAMPSAFSPHASHNLTTAVANQQQLAAQTDYMKQGHGGWKPGFTEVGRRSGQLCRPPVTLTTSQGKPHLQIHGSRNTQQWVVALYDYQKQRSDELAFSRGDVMRIICKDTDSWWLAQSEGGAEGYVPANYFTTQGDEGDDLLEYQKAIDKATDDDSDDVRRSRTAAVISKSGELKFISATEDSDAESTARRKKRVRKPRPSRDSSLSRASRDSSVTRRSRDSSVTVESDAESTTRVQRRRGSKVNESAA